MSANTYCVTGDFKVWLRDTIKQKAWQTLSHIHKILFGDAEYCGHEFMYRTKSIIKTMKMPSAKTTGNLYIKKSHVYLYDFFASTSKLRYDSWFQKNWNYEKYKVTFISCFLVIQFWITVRITVMHW